MDLIESIALGALAVVLGLFVKGWMYFFRDMGRRAEKEAGKRRKMEEQSEK